MKKSIFFLPFVVITFLLFSGCGGNNSGYGNGDIFIIKEQCLSAVNESKFDELNQVCNAKNEVELQRMILSGDVYIISSYTNAKMIDPGFAKSKIEIEISGEKISVYVSNEFLPKKQ